MPTTLTIRNRVRRLRARPGRTSCETVPAMLTSRPGGGAHERGERARGDDRGEDVAHRAGPRGGGDAQHDAVRVAGDVELGRERAAEQAVDGGEQVEDAEQAEHADRGPARGGAVRVGVEADEDVRQAHRPEERGQQQAVDQHRRAAAGLARRGATTRRRSARRCPRRRGSRCRAGCRSSPAGTVRVSPVSGNVSVVGSSSSTTMPFGPVRRELVRRTARPAPAARRGRSSSRIAGSAIANTFTQYWNACT